ncbi:MAG TPA: hypothetical protein VEB42_14460, partial [Chitinophagaceae bacterium]|nr:hypothetical protein [Chitinophagaceae bacterium]
GENLKMKNILLPVLLSFICLCSYSQDDMETMTPPKKKVTYDDDMYVRFDGNVGTALGDANNGLCGGASFTMGGMWKGLQSISGFTFLRLNTKSDETFYYNGDPYTGYTIQQNDFGITLGLRYSTINYYKVYGTAAFSYSPLIIFGSTVNLPDYGEVKIRFGELDVFVDNVIKAELGVGVRLSRLFSMEGNAVFTKVYNRAGLSDDPLLIGGQLGAIFNIEL